MLGTIINNTVFRLEMREDNLATRILARWRRQVVTDWRERYDDWVLGFETYVVENEHRVGTCYRADNWTLVGRTTGDKMIYCKKTEQFSGTSGEENVCFLFLNGFRRCTRRGR
jgi:hypothetical protein